MALAVCAAVAFGATFASASETETTSTANVAVSDGARSCDMLNLATGTITGAPAGASLEIVVSGIVFQATISGTNYSVNFNVGTPPATSFPATWRVSVVEEGTKKVIAEGTLQIKACTPVTPPTTPTTPPPTNPPVTPPTNPPVTTPPTSPPSAPVPPAQPAAPAPSRTVAKTS